MHLRNIAFANLVRSRYKCQSRLCHVSLNYLTWINYKLSDILTMLQVRTATDCIRYSQGVAVAVTSPPLLPPPGNRRQHGLITRRRTRVSLQRLPLSDFLSRPRVLYTFLTARSLHISCRANALRALYENARILVIRSCVWCVRI